MKRTGIRHFFSSFFRSMRLRVFLVVVLTGAAMAALFSFTAYSVYKTEAVNERILSVRDYTDKLLLKLESNVYSANPAQFPDINSELNAVADIYEGRIIVTDSGLNIIYDSYGVEVGKVLVSKEAIAAINGQKSEYRDNDRRRVELSFPIDEQGAFIIIFSVDDCYRMSDLLRSRLVMVGVMAFVVLTAVSAIVTHNMMKPFGRITQSLHHVSEGYTYDQVDIGGFSEMDKISDSFNEMLGRINTIENSRQEFVSNVSHELKTPITSIKVLAESLLSQPDAPAELYREFMSDINNEIDRENKIISDLLALVKLDRKSGDMHVAEVSINELLEQLLKRLKPIAQVAGVELIFESYREVIAEVDEVKLSLALSNLVENGIKYNKDGGTVTVSLNADHRYFMVRVTDTGIGIPEAEQERIFERFYRVDKMRSRQTGGTGLGLSITKSIVIMHHGAIKVESREGQGTTFMVRIPLSYIPEN